MSRKNELFLRIFTVLTAIFLLLSISVLTAAADLGADGGDTVIDGGDSGNIDSGDVPVQTPDDGGSGGDIENGNVDNGLTPDDGGGQSYEQPTYADTPDDSAGQYTPNENDYISGQDDLDDLISRYVPNPNLESLPTVAAAEVVEATAEPLPDVAVSDATLFSGIVMWLCVAVGISVVAGVMVSKRTHRRGV